MLIFMPELSIVAWLLTFFWNHLFFRYSIFQFRFTLHVEHYAYLPCSIRSGKKVLYFQDNKVFTDTLKSIIQSHDEFRLPEFLSLAKLEKVKVKYIADDYKLDVGSYT